MKSFLKLLIVTIATFLMLSVGVFAEGEPALTITNETIDKTAGIYAFRVSAEADPGIKVFSIHFSYNSDVVIPYDANYLDGPFDMTDTEKNETTEYHKNLYYKDTNGFCFDVPSKLSLNAVLYEINEAGNRVAVYPTFTTTSNLKAHKTGTVFDFYYTLASGKTLNDVKFALEDSDTVFINIKSTDTTRASIHTFVQDTEGTRHYGANGEIAVDAFFDNINETATVSGKVTSSSEWEAIVTLSDSAKRFVTETVNGVYKFDKVPFGIYNLQIKKNAHLAYLETGLVVSDDLSKDVSLLGGDINADGVIDHLDLGQLLINYQKTSEESDITGDGVVNHLDLGALLSNYRKSYSE